MRLRGAREVSSGWCVGCRPARSRSLRNCLGDSSGWRGLRQPARTEQVLTCANHCKPPQELEPGRQKAEASQETVSSRAHSRRRAAAGRVWAKAGQAQRHCCDRSDPGSPLQGSEWQLQPSRGEAGWTASSSPRRLLPAGCSLGSACAPPAGVTGSLALKGCGAEAPTSCTRPSAGRERKQSFVCEAALGARESASGGCRPPASPVIFRAAVV